MKLVALYEDSLSDKLISAIGKRFFKKLADPLRPEKSGNAASKLLPQRSGNQDTPLTPRLRDYFNSPIGTANKIGYGEIDNTSSRRAKSIEDTDNLKYPIDQTPEDKQIEKKARKAFGNQAISGQKPRLRL